MNRRTFLRLLGLGATATAAGLVVAEAEPVRRIWSMGLGAPTKSRAEWALPTIDVVTHGSDRWNSRFARYFADGRVRTAQAISIGPDGYAHTARPGEPVVGWAYRGDAELDRQHEAKQRAAYDLEETARRMGENAGRGIDARIESANGLRLAHTTIARIDGNTITLSEPLSAAAYREPIGTIESYDPATGLATVRLGGSSVDTQVGDAMRRAARSLARQINEGLDGTTVGELARAYRARARA